MIKNKKKAWLLITLSTIGLWITVYFILIYIALPSTKSLEDYNPPLITTVLDQKGRVIGEFFKERRRLTPEEEFPEFLIQAFVSAEDGHFFNHQGINLLAIFRAFIANIKAGKKVQGGSTITQQVARSLLLSSKKTYTRKLQEIILALSMERHLTKKEILYLYLNQIYLGHGAYGVNMASHIYFKKSVKDLTLEEAALLAGLPQAPSRFSPISNAKKAKQRQIYVLSRMVDEGYISPEQAQESRKKPLTIYMRENYSSLAPYFVETLRQILINKLGEETLLTGGLTLFSSVDLDIQKSAQIQLKKGLKELDKRQGYRGALQNLSKEEQVDFWIQEQKAWVSKRKKHRILLEDGQDGVLDTDYTKIKTGEQTKGIVQAVEKNLVYVDLMFSLKGIIPLETSRWARKPNKKAHYRLSQIQSMKEALKPGDVILVKLEDPDEKTQLSKQHSKLLKKDHLLLSLEQEPLVQGALIAFNQNNEGVLAMVGGYDFSKSQFNRAYQAQRQTGSVFKPIIYASALDKGFKPNSIISDSPVVYEDTEADPLKKQKGEPEEDDPQQWKPMNYSQKFTGDTLLRNALVRSLNIPTVKLIDKIGIPWIEFYARRLGITSLFHSDYTVALGSSSVSLYEMTKAFSIFGRGGQNIQPIILDKVEDSQGFVLLEKVSLDEKFKDQMEGFKEEFKKSWQTYWDNKKKKDDKKSSIFFEDLNQIISPQTAYLISSLLQGVISDSSGTGHRASDIAHPIAGKTGTTNGYLDAWFIGYSPEISAGVWVGFDHQESLGQSETGSRAALPIWHRFMKNTLKEKEITEFKIPGNIVFAHIDSQTGYLAGEGSKEVIRQAFLEGTEPSEQKEILIDDEDQNFLREDLAL